MQNIDALIDLMRRAEYDGLNGMTPIFGVRRLPAADVVTVGFNLPYSQQWDDDQPTGVGLGGVCALAVEINEKSLKQALKTIQGYHDGQTLIVAGADAGTGMDAGEIIIKDAVVIAIV